MWFRSLIRALPERLLLELFWGGEPGTDTELPGSTHKDAALQSPMLVAPQELNV